MQVFWHTWEGSQNSGGLRSTLYLPYLLPLSKGEKLLKLSWSCDRSLNFSYVPDMCDWWTVRESAVGRQFDSQKWPSRLPPHHPSPLQKGHLHVHLRCLQDQISIRFIVIFTVNPWTDTNITKSPSGKLDKLRETCAKCKSAISPPSLSRSRRRRRRRLSELSLAENCSLFPILPNPGIRVTLAEREREREGWLEEQTIA